MRNAQKTADLDDLNWAANEDENPRADLGDFNPGDGGEETQITHHVERGRGRVLIKHPTTFLATPEQQAIIDALPIILPGEVLKIQALSGTGKTATLIRLAEAYPELSFLYLAYNADIAKDAAKRFPDNVVVKTTHGLAHGAVDIRSWMNVKRLGNIRRWEMESWLRSRRFDPKLVTGAGLGAVAADVLATVRRFCQSADPAISRRHTWPSDKKTNRDAFRELAQRQNPDAKLAEANGDAAFTRYRDWLAEKAQAVWLAVTNPDDSSLVLEHDVYLKLYQLRGPKLDYHVIMTDEFQDTNKCVLSLIMAQRHAVIVVVGDPNQAIYGFRGAMDAMALITARMSLPLSQSHRFGQAIADQANRILAYKAAHYGGFIPLRGTPTIISTIETLASPPYTVICRSNRGVFEEALKAVTAGLKINAGAKDLEGAIRYVESVWSLLTGTRIAQMDPDIAEFADGQVLLDEAKSDHALKWVVKFCQEHVDDLPDICGRLRAAKTRMKKQADVLLTTAHRCVHPDTLVETPNGLTAIKNIPDCGMVATPFGPRGYQGKFIRGESETLIITTKKGYSIEVTPDHGITVMKRQGSLRVEAGNLKLGDQLCLRTGAIIDPEIAPEIQVAEFHLDQRAVRFSLPTKMSYELSEFLGLMVADGSVFRRGFRVTKRHQDVLDRFCQLTETLFGYRALLGDNEGTACYTVHSAHISGWLLALGGLAPHAKGIPDCVLASPLELQAAFLRGLFEDGTVNIKQKRIDHIHFETKFPEIAKTVQVMLLRFGIIATRKERTSNRRFIVSLYIYGDNMLVFREKIGFISQFKNERLDQVLPVVRCNDLIMVSDFEVESLRSRIGFYDFQNVRSRKTVSRHKARQFLAQNPDDPDLAWLSCKLQWHYDPIVSIEKSASETLCITVPDGARFLQNGFDGWNSKGLEFQHVRLANDFVALDSKLDEAVNAMADRNWTGTETLLRELPGEELHLLYVAATRARVTLQPNQTLTLLDTLAPALARLQSKAGYVAPEATPNGQAAADVATSDTEEARRVWLSFYPEMQAAITDAARYEGWTPAKWVTEVLEVRNLIVASGYSKSFIDDLTSLYRKVTVPETSDRTDRTGQF